MGQEVRYGSIASFRPGLNISALPRQADMISEVAPYSRTNIAPHLPPQARIRRVSRTVSKHEFHDPRNAVKTEDYALSSREARMGYIIEITKEF